MIKFSIGTTVRAGRASYIYKEETDTWNIKIAGIWP